MFSPTDEQKAAIDLFSGGGSLRIDAYAGTGKTSTLRLLAESTRRKGHYLAFNKSIANDAQQKFPRSVECTTNHSLAYRAIRSQYQYSNEKMTRNANANMIADGLGLPEDTQAADRFFLSKRSYGAVLKGAMRRFLYSEDEAPGAKHFPRTGKLAELDRTRFEQFTSNALTDLSRLWDEMQNPMSRVPLGFDGYLKLWALGRPRIHADYVMLDEAQDSNPVMLKVLREQPCQMIYVGDPYQQIYEWRGAINAMERVVTDNHSRLTQSFRFGNSIADGATKVISRLGAKAALRGLPMITSHICPVHPKTILCRTNAGVISNLVTHQNNNGRTHVVGGTQEQQWLLEDVKRLKKGIPSELPEFYGFSNWNDVLQHVEQEQDEALRLLVKLVTQYGEDRLLMALRNCVATEDEAQIIVSTAHKAKGREWDVVQVERDFDAAFTVQDQPEGISKWDLEAEGRLFYVAMTRAKSAVQLPPGAMLFFGITNSQSEHYGTPYISESHPAAMAASANPRFGSPYRQMTPTQRAPFMSKPSSPPIRQETSGGGFFSKFFRTLFGK